MGTVQVKEEVWIVYMFHIVNTPRSLEDLKDNISQKIPNIPPNILRKAHENAHVYNA